MKKTILALALASVGLCGVASAQVDATPTNLTFRGGFLLPLDEDLRENSDFYGSLGIDYEFPRQIIRGSTTYASLEWWFKGTSGDVGNVFPLTLNQRFYSGVGNQFYDGGRTYFFVGLGAAFMNVGGNSDSPLILRGGIGAEFGPNIIGEVVLTLGEEADGGGRPNSVGFYIGYKF